VNGSKIDPSLGNERHGKYADGDSLYLCKYLVLKGIYGVMRPETTHKLGPLLAARDKFFIHKALTSASGSETASMEPVGSAASVAHAWQPKPARLRER